MSLDSYCWARKVKTGNPLSKLILLTISDNANQDNEVFTPHERICQFCECDESSLKRSLGEMQDAGLITIKPSSIILNVKES